jgi:aspartate kinase
VADVGKLRYVAERVMQTARRGHQVVVVVSAMGDTTDELLAMVKQGVAQSVCLSVHLRTGVDS